MSGRAPPSPRNAIDPEDPDRVFAGVEHGGLIFTDDGGDTWVPVGPSHGKIRAITAAPLP